MKKYTLCLMCLFVVNQGIAGSDESERQVEAISQKAAEKDIQGLIAALPALEALWQQDPNAYLEAMKSGMPVLIASSDPEARKSALATFSNVLDKKGPADTKAATTYFGLKRNIVSDFFNMEEIRKNKNHLLMVAGFVGEIRSRRIPDYENRGTNLPGNSILREAGVDKAANLPTAALKEAYAQAKRQNIENFNMNDLQSILSSADWNLTSLLQTYVQGFSVKEPANLDFYEEVVKRAKLTEPERKQLYTPR